ncbi:MAG: hydrogenase maturation nickel metallochaperone HypA [Acidimicrobiales bacterium]
MHELSLCEAIAKTVVKHAGGKPVAEVAVRIGYLRQVVPDALLFSWEMITSGSDLEGSTLAIEQVPAVVTCDVCGAETTLDMPIMLCGTCEASTVTLVSGEEFQVVSLELAEA